MLRKRIIPLSSTNLRKLVPEDVMRFDLVLSRDTDHQVDH